MRTARMRASTVLVTDECALGAPVGEASELPGRSERLKTQRLKGEATKPQPEGAVGLKPGRHAPVKPMRRVCGDTVLNNKRYHSDH